MAGGPPSSELSVAMAQEHLRGRYQAAFQLSWPRAAQSAMPRKAMTRSTVARTRYSPGTELRAP